MITAEDLAKSLTQAGIDTPEKLTTFIVLAAKQVQRVAKLTAAEKVRADGQAAHNAANSAAAQLDADAAALQAEITALISQ